MNLPDERKLDTYVRTYARIVYVCMQALHTVLRVLCCSTYFLPAAAAVCCVGPNDGLPVTHSVTATAAAAAESILLLLLLCDCLLYTSPSPRDRQKSRMPSSA